MKCCRTKLIVLSRDPLSLTNFSTESLSSCPDSTLSMIWYLTYVRTVSSSMLGSMAQAQNVRDDSKPQTRGLWQLTVFLALSTLSKKRVYQRLK